MWENFLIIERAKKFLNQGFSVQGRFWRSYSGSEVDYVEEEGTKHLDAYEFKFGSSGLRRGADAFTRAYEVDIQLVNQDNFLSFITG